MAEAITLTGTRRRLVEIDALVALGGSRIARPSSERVPERVSHRVSTQDSDHFRPAPRTWQSLTGTLSFISGDLRRGKAERRESMMHPHWPGPLPVAVPDI